MDKVIVITGASGGIGAEVARQLSKAGASIVLVARRKAELESVAAECGEHAMPIVADVTVRSEVRRVITETLARFGRVDVWINNVGRGITRVPSELTDEDIDETMRANVKSALYGMQEILPHFKSRGEGHIINISSLLGRVPFAVFRSAYSASKFYLNALTEMFRAELKPTHPNIQFSLVSPGVVRTEFGRNARHGGPDSNTLPGSQSAAEVAAVIGGVIDSRKPDVYTRPGSQQSIAEFYARLGEDPG